MIVIEMSTIQTQGTSKSFNVCGVAVKNKSNKRDGSNMITGILD